MQLTDHQYRVLVVVAGVLFMILAIWIRFYGDFNLPKTTPRPSAAVTNARAISQSIERSTDAYKEYLRVDSATFGLSSSSVREMSSVFPYRAEHERHELEVGESIEVLDLTLTLSVEKIKGSKRPHMILSIESRSHKPLAYRVETKPSVGTRSCSRMSHLPHNALALSAGGIVKRAECVYRKGWSLAITMVETVALPELGYLYLSSAQADQLGLDERTSTRHTVPLDSMACRILQSASKRNAVLSGKLTWRDQVDFYARHRCKTYTLPVTYKAFQRDAEQKLPVTEGDL